MSEDITSEIDDVMRELKNTVPHHNSTLTTTTPQVSADPITDSNLSEYVYEKASSLVDECVSAVKRLTPLVMAAQDPKEIAALASLVNAANKAIANLNELNLQRRQHDVAVKLKEMEIVARNQLMDKLPATQNNIVISTREEMLAEILGNRKKPEKIIEVRPELEN